MKSVYAIHRFFKTHPLTCDEPLGAWTRFISWQIRARLQDEVMVPWIEGQRLVVRRGMTGATGNIYAGLHEFYDMMLLLHFLRREDLFFDVGANVGSYTVLASGICGAKTWAFEPDPLTVRNLQRNIDINNLCQMVNVCRVALGSSNSEVKFTVGRDTVNRVANEMDSEVRVVPQRRLDDISAGCNPAMLKIDVEGYEESVIGGAQDILANESLKVLEVETVNERVMENIKSHGFVQCSYDPVNRIICFESANKKSTNYTFVRDIEFVQGRLSAALPVRVLGRLI